MNAIDRIIYRIESATPESPIVVFRTGRNLKAVFHTLSTSLMVRNALELGDPDYIGTFDNTMNLEKVREILEDQ